MIFRSSSPSRLPRVCVMSRPARDAVVAERRQPGPRPVDERDPRGRAELVDVHGVRRPEAGRDERREARAPGRLVQRRRARPGRATRAAARAARRARGAPPSCAAPATRARRRAPAGRRPRPRPGSARGPRPARRRAGGRAGGASRAPRRRAARRARRPRKRRRGAAAGAAPMSAAGALPASAAGAAVTSAAGTAPDVRRAASAVRTVAGEVGRLRPGELVAEGAQAGLELSHRRPPARRAAGSARGSRGT